MRRDRARAGKVGRWLAGLAAGAGWVVAAPSLWGQQGPPTDRDALVDAIRYRTPDAESSARYVQVLVAVVGLTALVWLGQRLWVAWRGGRGRRQKSRMWALSLRRHGLDPVERDFLARLARGIDAAPGALVQDRSLFERAVDGARELLRSDERAARLLQAVRGKLGWDDAAGATRAPQVQPIPRHAQVLELNQELELFATGADAGYCARAVLVHLDPLHLVFKMLAPDEDSPWKPGSRLQVYFWRSNDAGYLFETTVQERRETGNGYLITEPPCGLERQQKRIHVRVPCAIPVDILHLPLDRVSALIGVSPRVGGLMTAHIEDLSAGGFRIATSTALEPGDYISIASFPPAGGQEVLARIIAPLEESDGRRLYGAQFIGLSMEHRDRVAARVFELQRRSIAERRERESSVEAATGFAAAAPVAPSAEPDGGSGAGASAAE